MSLGPDGRSLKTETRAVAPVIAVVLLFGFTTVGFSLYQAEIIPDQNAQTEFQHFQHTQDQMVAIQSAAVDAAAIGEQRSVVFQLGTEFQPRYFGVNPPPPTGQLATSETYTMTIIRNTGANDTVEARFLTYEPNYRELQAGCLRYEHGITYIDARETGGGIILQEGQTAPLQLAPLQNEFSTSGQRQISLQLEPTTAKTLDDITSGDRVRIPTRLPNPNTPENNSWDDTLGITVDNASYEYNSSGPNYVTIDGSEVADITAVGTKTLPGDDPEATNEQASSGSPSVPGGSSAVAEQVVFTTDDDEDDEYELQVLSLENGNPENPEVTAIGDTAQVIGPVDPGQSEFPYVTASEELKYSSTSGEITEADLSEGKPQTPSQGASLVVIGSWEIASDAIYYVNQKGGISRYNIEEEGTEQIRKQNVFSDTPKAVIGFIGTDDDELVFVDSNGNIKSFDTSSQEAPTEIGANNGAGSNGNTYGIGQPAQVTPDGPELIPIVDGSNVPKLIDPTAGKVYSPDGDPSEATKSPIASANIERDADETAELVYIPTGDDADVVYLDIKELDEENGKYTFETEELSLDSEPDIRDSTGVS